MDSRVLLIKIGKCDKMWLTNSETQYKSKNIKEVTTEGMNVLIIYKN